MQKVLNLEYLLILINKTMENSNIMKYKDELIANLYDEINRLKAEKKVKISTPVSEAAEAKVSSGIFLLLLLFKMLYFRR